MTTPPDRRRRQGGIALVVLTALLIAGAAVSWYAQEEVVNSSRFSTRAASALDDSDVRTVLADRMVGGLTRSAVPDALVVRPLLVPVLATLADTSAFRRLFTQAVRDRHRALIDHERPFTFELPLGQGVLFDLARARGAAGRPCGSGGAEGAGRAAGPARFRDGRDRLPSGLGGLAMAVDARRAPRAPPVPACSPGASGQRWCTWEPPRRAGA